MAPLSKAALTRLGYLGINDYDIVLSGRYVQVRSGAFRYVQVRSSTFRYVQVGLDTFRYVQVHSGRFSGTFRYVGYKRLLKRYRTRAIIPRSVYSIVDFFAYAIMVKSRRRYIQEGGLFR